MADKTILKANSIAMQSARALEPYISGYGAQLNYLSSLPKGDDKFSRANRLKTLVHLGTQYDGALLVVRKISPDLRSSWLAKGIIQQAVKKTGDAPAQKNAGIIQEMIQGLTPILNKVEAEFKRLEKLKLDDEGEHEEELERLFEDFNKKFGEFESAEDDLVREYAGTNVDAQTQEATHSQDGKEQPHHVFIKFLAAIYAFLLEVYEITRNHQEAKAA